MKYSRSGIFSWRTGCAVLCGVFICTLLAADLLRVRVTQASALGLPEPMALVEASPAGSLPVVKGLRLNPADPLKLEFIIDAQNGRKVSDEDAALLVKYFLAALTTPEKDLWVNLSPDEEDRILPDSLVATDIGRDLMEQDYLLKQLASSLTHPDTPTGEAYWRVENGKSTIENRLGKIWIVPDTAEVYESGTTAVITEASLKLQCEDDAQQVLLPEITRDVNEGKNFAKLRQIYHSLILAAWFKQKLRESFYRHYIDQNKTSGIDVSDPALKEKIFGLYVQSFEKGVYDVLRNSADSSRVERPGKRKRRFFSGGFAGEVSSVLNALPVSSSVVVNAIPAGALRYTVRLVHTFGGTLNSLASSSALTYVESKAIGGVDRRYREFMMLGGKMEDAIRTAQSHRSISILNAAADAVVEQALARLDACYQKLMQDFPEMRANISEQYAELIDRLNEFCVNGDNPEHKTYNYFFALGPQSAGSFKRTVAAMEILSPLADRDTDEGPVKVIEVRQITRFPEDKIRNILGLSAGWTNYVWVFRNTLDAFIKESGFSEGSIPVATQTLVKKWQKLRESYRHALLKGIPDRDRKVQAERMMALTDKQLFRVAGMYRDLLIQGLGRQGVHGFTTESERYAAARDAMIRHEVLHKRYDRRKLRASVESAHDEALEEAVAEAGVLADSNGLDNRHVFARLLEYLVGGLPQAAMVLGGLVGLSQDAFYGNIDASLDKLEQLVYAEPMLLNQRALATWQYFDRVWDRHYGISSSVGTVDLNAANASSVVLADGALQSRADNRAVYDIAARASREYRTYNDLAEETRSLIDFYRYIDDTIAVSFRDFEIADKRDAVRSFMEVIGYSHLAGVAADLYPEDAEKDYVYPFDAVPGNPYERLRVSSQAVYNLITMPDDILNELRENEVRDFIKENVRLSGHAGVVRGDMTPSARNDPEIFENAEQRKAYFEDATGLVNRLIVDGTPFTEQVLFEIYGMLTRASTKIRWAPADGYRSGDIYSPGWKHVSGGEQVVRAMEEYWSWFAVEDARVSAIKDKADRAAEAIVFASRARYHFAHIHPFQDYTYRIETLIGEYILCKNNLRGIPMTPEMEEEYLLVQRFMPIPEEYGGVNSPYFPAELALFLARGQIESSSALNKGGVDFKGLEVSAGGSSSLFPVDAPFDPDGFAGFAAVPLALEALDDPEEFLSGIAP